VHAVEVVVVNRALCDEGGSLDEAVDAELRLVSDVTLCDLG
jgi:hypothetical protein